MTQKRRKPVVNMKRRNKKRRKLKNINVSRERADEEEEQ